MKKIQQTDLFLTFCIQEEIKCKLDIPFMDVHVYTY